MSKLLIKPEEGVAFIKRCQSNLNYYVDDINDYRTSLQTLSSKFSSKNQNDALNQSYTSIKENTELLYERLKKLNNLYNTLMDSIKGAVYLTGDPNQIGDFMTALKDYEQGKKGVDLPNIYSPMASSGELLAKYGSCSSYIGTKTQDKDEPNQTKDDSKDKPQEKEPKKEEQIINEYNPDEVIRKISATKDGAKNGKFIDERLIIDEAFRDTERLTFEPDYESGTTLIYRDLGNGPIAIGYTKGIVGVNNDNKPASEPPKTNSETSTKPTSNYGSTSSVYETYIKGNVETRVEANKAQTEQNRVDKIKSAGYGSSAGAYEVYNIGEQQQKLAEENFRNKIIKDNPKPVGMPTTDYEKYVDYKIREAKGIDNGS